MKRQVLLNALGYAAQIASGLLAVPWLLEALGVVGFGLFSLALAAVGYLGLFDLGFGRALTRLVADCRGRGATADVADLVRSALWTLGGLGLAAAALLLLVGPDACARWLGLTPGDAASLRRAFPWLAACLPFAIAIPALSGVLEGYLRFDLSAAARATGGVAAALGPVIATQFDPSLAAAVAGLCLARLITCAGLIVVVARLVPGLVRVEGVRRAAIAALLRDGGWLTVTNLVGPLMASLDRFAIGRWVSVATITYYAAPYEALTRVWAIPDALLGVMFPALAHAGRDTERQAELCDRALRVLIALLVPILGAGIVFAPELLELWVGGAVAVHAAPVARWLAAGVLINALVRVPFVFLQARGRADLPARAHVAELVPYLAGLYAACRWGGVVGAAFAWTCRIVVDAAVLSGFAVRVLPALARPFGRAALWTCGALAVLAALAVLPWGARVGTFTVATGLWAVLVMAGLLHPAEQAFVKARLFGRL